MDEFNLKGLNKYVSHFKEAIFRILDLENSGKTNYQKIESENEKDSTAENVSEIKKNANILYGLVHARYIQTTKGLKLMVKNNIKFSKE